MYDNSSLYAVLKIPFPSHGWVRLEAGRAVSRVSLPLPVQMRCGFRRTAARNLVRAGVLEPVAMKLTGHLTPSVFKRYAIVDESMLRAGAEKLSALYADRAIPERKVVSLDR